MPRPRKLSSVEELENAMVRFLADRLDDHNLLNREHTEKGLRHIGIKGMARLIVLSEIDLPSKDPAQKQRKQRSQNGRRKP